MNPSRLFPLAAALGLMVAIALVANPTPFSVAWAQEPATDTSSQPAENAPGEETPAESDQPADAQPNTGTETPPAGEDPPATTEESPAEEAPSDSPPADAPATDAPITDEPEGESEEDSTGQDSSTLPAEAPLDGEEVPAGEETTEQRGLVHESTKTATAEDSKPTFLESLIPIGWGLLLLLGLLVLPILLGNLIAGQLKMPDYGWKISLVLVTLAITGYAMATGRYKLGPDLGGGFSLIYDLADEQQRQRLQGEEGVGVRKVNMEELRGALQRRIDPSGQLEVSIRTIGESVEIIMPKAGNDELERIKDTLTRLGELEFRILVDSLDPSQQQLIASARELPKSQRLASAGALQAKWVPYNVDEFGRVDQFDPSDGGEPQFRRNAVKREGLNGPEILVLIDEYNVTGQYLSSASMGIDITGPMVNFSFDSMGARRFGELTGQNKPKADGDLSFLGIILDDKLLSAPSIRSQITSHGQISGAGMNEEEVQQTVDILNAGSLPAALNRVPVSEETISPQLGKQTIEHGTYSILISLVAVLLFILVYYRFAGFVACLALIFNVALVVACMLMFQAAFTLPGLAGLVLTVGMSVDANVLIYERMREELGRGASLRMAIRNGFSRATTTIIDSNLTTLITGVVLYVIGTDQVRGFAITLILGIVMSMYTAIFCSRLIFDIAERKGWIRELRMMRFLTETNWDFLKMSPIAWVGSFLVIVAGIGAMVARGTDLLNIDFTGGTSVYFVLDDQADIAEVRDVLEHSELADKNLLVVARGTIATGNAKSGNTTYSVDTSVVDEVTEDGQTIDAAGWVKGVISEKFKGKLRTYEVRADEPVFVPADGTSPAAVETTLHFGPQGEITDEQEQLEGVSYQTVVDNFEESLAKLGHVGIAPIVTSEKYEEGSTKRIRTWQVRLELPESDARQAVSDVVTRLNDQPIFPQANKIGGRVADDMQVKALYAILVSMLGIVAYVWVRFQRLTFGIAAVACLVHDVLVAVGLLALSKYLFDWAEPVASALMIEPFQIGLTIVAALLTLIGYSINDTIVIFDRVREVKGKSKSITGEMLNTSINQTLSRTILTSGSTLIVVVILYIFGGEGLHAFAFTLLVGVIAGSYSTIFIACPLLLWMIQWQESRAQSTGGGLIR